MTWCDAAQEIQNEQLAHWLHDNLPAMKMHILAAGVVSFDLIPDMHPSTFHRVAAPKVSRWPIPSGRTLWPTMTHCYQTSRAASYFL